MLCLSKHYARELSNVRQTVITPFLPRDAMHKRGICHHAVSVCVCLSVRLTRS